MMDVCKIQNLSKLNAYANLQLDMENVLFLFKVILSSSFFLKCSFLHYLADFVI